MNILYYGNCQLYGVKQILNLNNYIETSIECYSTTLNEGEFENIISQQDIIISQPISDNYRDKPYLSTNFIINHCKETCKLIIFDSCYFNFYYFDLTYKEFNNDILHQPIDYHYHTMIECYKNNLSVDYYIENYVNNVNLKSKEELEYYANQSLDELNSRHYRYVEKYKVNNNIYFISTYDYIKNNYKDKLLFYSMNHPTKFVLQYICEEIVKILIINNTILYNINVLDNPKSIIYKCIQKVVNFDINECNPLTSGITDVNQITQLYYDTYRNIGF
jgi:hypothetical protein